MNSTDFFLSFDSITSVPFDSISFWGLNSMSPKIRLSSSYRPTTPGGVKSRMLVEKFEEIDEKSSRLLKSTIREDCRPMKMVSLKRSWFTEESTFLSTICWARTPRKSSASRARGLRMTELFKS